jgi:hypothetical protein
MIRLERSSRSRLAIALASLLVLAGVCGMSVAVASEPDGSVDLETAEGAPAPEWFEPEDFPGAGGDGAEQLQDAALERRIALAQRAEWLESPQAISEREQSRSAFRELSDAAALDLLSSRWADVLRPPLPDAETLVGSDEIAGFADDATMRVDGLNGHDDRLIVSDIPLRAPNESGVKEPTDVDLSKEGEDFIPENSTADVTMPVALEDGATVDVIEVTPSGQAEGVKIDGDTVAYPNAELDTDVALVSTLTGIETFHQLRSDRAPEDLLLDVAVPGGASLEATPSGGVNVVDADGLVASISPATAVDAQGEPVPAGLAIDGSAVVIHVDHQDADVAYPILVDPFVEEDWAHNGTTNTTGTWFHQNAAAIAGLNRWSHTHSANIADNVYAPRLQCYAPVAYTCYSPSHNGSAADGLHMLVRSNTTYPAGSYGEWYYVPPGFSTRINRVDWGAMHLRPGGTAANPSFFYGILSNVSQNWLALRTFSNSTAGGAVNNITHDWYAQFAGSQPGPQYLVAGWQSTANASVPYWRDGYIGGMIVQLTDPDQPTNLGITKTGPTDWTNNGSFTAAPSARDAGVGMKSFTLRVPSSSGSQVQTRTHPCSGRKGNECPSYDYRTPPAASSTAWTLPDASITGVNGTAFSYSVADANPAVAGDQPMPEGVNTVTVEARDIIHPEAPTTTTWQVKVDRTNPTASLSGVEDAELLVDDDYPMTASGQDALSGAASVSIKLDGVTKATNSSCPPAGQACSASWTLDGSDPSLGDGPHTLEVITTDRAGNVMTDTTDVLVDRTGPTINVAGDLDKPETTDWTGGFLGSGNHILRMVVADDDASASAATGAADLALYVDGVLKAQKANPACSDDVCAVDEIATVDTTPLSDGAHTVQVVAHDQVGNTATRTWNIKADNHAPTVQVSGALFDGSTEVAAASETMTISATDGPSAFSPQSVVTSIAVSIDDHEVSRLGRDASDCGFVACSMQHSYTLDASTLTTGDHQIVVETTDAAANTTTTTWTITVPTALAGTTCPPSAAASVGAPVPSGEIVTPAVAENQLDQYAPAVIAPSAPTGTGDEMVDPTIETRPESVASAGTLAPAEAATPLHEGIAVGDPAAPVCIAPADVAPNASAPTVVGGDSALIANSQPHVDTVVRPTAVGLETLLQIRDDSAPENFDWKVTLQPGQALQQIAPDLVAVVDVAGPGQAPEAVGADEQAAPGTDTATDIDDNWAAPGGSTTDPALPPAPTLDPTAEGQRDAVPDAAVQFRQAVVDIDRAQDVVAEDVVGVISAPWATDATGVSVPITLDVDGDHVTMSVDHEGAAFPVVADPTYATASAAAQAPAIAASADKNDCPPGQSPCGTYNWKAAANYAMAHAKKFNLHYANYAPNDCTNFVSQALQAGGMNFMREWGRGEGSWWAQTSRGIQLSSDSTTHSWRIVETLKKHLLDYGLAVNTDKWRVGDLVWWNWHDGGSNADHFHIVTKIVSGVPRLAGHGGKPGADSNYAEMPLPKVKQRVVSKHPRYSFARLHIRKTKANIN